MQKSAWIIIVCSKQSNEHDKGHPPKQIVEILIKHTYTFFIYAYSSISPCEGRQPVLYFS